MSRLFDMCLFHECFEYIKILPIEDLVLLMTEFEDFESVVYTLSDESYYHLRENYNYCRSLLM